MTARTHCKRGHPFDETNTYIAPKTGIRNCRACQRQRIDAWAKSGSPGGEPKGLFGGNREAVILRDGEKCVRCGMTRAEHRKVIGRDITVDHIDGRGTSLPTHLKNNSPDNLQTLCLPCHASKDNKARKLTTMQVVNIRHIARTITYMEVGRLYGVGGEHIGRINNGIWRSPELIQRQLEIEYGAKS